MRCWVYSTSKCHSSMAREENRRLADCRKKVDKLIFDPETQSCLKALQTTDARLR